MASPSLLIVTERQALVSLARQFLALGEATEGLNIEATLEAALAVVAGGLVIGGKAAYQEGNLGAMTLTPSGELRVQTQDVQIQWFGVDPFAGCLSGADPYVGAVWGGDRG